MATSISIGLIALAAVGLMTQMRPNYPHRHDWDDDHRSTKITIRPGRARYPEDDYWDEYDRNIQSLDPYVYIIVLFILLLLLANAWN